MLTCPLIKCGSVKQWCGWGGFSFSLWCLKIPNKYFGAVKSDGGVGTIGDVTKISDGSEAAVNHAAFCHIRWGGAHISAWALVSIAALVLCTAFVRLLWFDGRGWGGGGARYPLPPTPPQKNTTQMGVWWECEGGGRGRGTSNVGGKECTVLALRRIQDETRQPLEKLLWDVRYM